VRELAAEFGWEDHRPPRSEADVPRLVILMEFAEEAGLVRRTRSSVRRTDRGRSAAADPAVLWERVVRALAAGSDYTAAVRELLLVRLLKVRATTRRSRSRSCPSCPRRAGGRPTAAS
jgi:hypothetical protein